MDDEEARPLSGKGRCGWQDASKKGGEQTRPSQSEDVSGGHERFHEPACRDEPHASQRASTPQSSRAFRQDAKVQQFRETRLAEKADKMVDAGESEEGKGQGKGGKK